jgi:TolB-like protein
MQRVNKFLTIFFLTAITMIYAQTEERLKIAVLDFNNTGGLSQQESNTLANRLRSMLVQQRNLIVLERGKMEDILSEQGFQQTGCTSTECAVEVGKLLNVQKMVSGSVGKIGETYTIDIVLIDVSTAQINKSFMRNHKGAVDGLLEVMQSISDQIAGFGTKKEEIKKYVISITSSPAEADLFINNKKISKTPFKSTVDDGRALKVTIKKKNYKNWEKRITVKDNIEIAATLEMTEAYKRKLVEKARKEKKESIAKKEGGSGTTWLWIGGGAAIVAGGAAFLILNQKDEDKPSEGVSLFPGSPPGRPPLN